MNCLLSCFLFYLQRVEWIAMQRLYLVMWEVVDWVERWWEQRKVFLCMDLPQLLTFLSFWVLVKHPVWNDIGQSAHRNGIPPSLQPSCIGYWRVCRVDCLICACSWGILHLKSPCSQKAVEASSRPDNLFTWREYEISSSSSVYWSVLMRLYEGGWIWKFHELQMRRDWNQQQLLADKCVWQSRCATAK